LPVEEKTGGTVTCICHLTVPKTIHSMKQPSRIYVSHPIKVPDKTSHLSWFITESGTVCVWLQYGTSENYRLTDVNGSIIETGAMQEGRITFLDLHWGTYTLQVKTTKGIITKEIDIQ
jgi:hypothetical protein